MAQYLRRCAQRGGLYWEHRQGIALGYPLSPIIGAFYLSELDEALHRLGLFFVRYMDDILVLAPTRWKLRHAVSVVNQALNRLRLAKHPDKTFIGRIDKGFDFVGYHLRPGHLGVASEMIQRFFARAGQLYEQELERPKAASKLGVYVQRWWRWARGGLAPHTLSETATGVVRNGWGPTVLSCRWLGSHRPLGTLPPHNPGMSLDATCVSPANPAP